MISAHGTWYSPAWNFLVYEPGITTERAGLAGMPGVTEVAFGDVSALSEAIAHSLEQMN